MGMTADEFREQNERMQEERWLAERNAERVAEMAPADAEREERFARFAHLGGLLADAEHLLEDEQDGPAALVKVREAIALLGTHTAMDLPVTSADFMRGCW